MEDASAISQEQEKIEGTELSRGTSTPPTDQPAEQPNQVAELEERLAQMKDRMLRLAADFENYKKRTQAEREELLKFSTEGIIVEMLPVLDGFGRALASTQSGDDIKVVMKGVALIKKQFEDVLEKAGLTRVETTGKMFDPKIHEAAMMESRPDKADHEVLEELQSGYLLNGRLLRAAMVVVNQLASH